MAIPKERLILNFHGIGPIPTRIGLAERAYWCDDRFFKSMLDSIVNVPQQVSIELTFDDGNISDAVVALPALVSRGLTACFFVCAGRIGLEGYLDRSAMNELISAGMEIGSHGWNHVNWRRIDDKTLDIEIDDARKNSRTLLPAMSTNWQFLSVTTIVEYFVGYVAATVRSGPSSPAMGDVLPLVDGCYLVSPI